MISSLAVVAFAALIHASFQLSVSMLTLLSGHAIGSKTSHARLLRLTSSFLLGVGIMTLLAISSIAFLFQQLFTHSTPLIVWAIVCGLLVGLGVAVWAFYYRPGKGTSLWVPRGIARYLNDRTKATKHASEAFGLGLSSVVGELVFILIPMILSALVLIRLEPLWQLVGVGIYVFISLLTLGVVYALIGSGHKLSRIQKWREDNKYFLQFTAGSGLLVLGFYVYIDQVVSVTTLAMAGH